MSKESTTSPESTAAENRYHRSPPRLFPALGEAKDLGELNQAITDYVQHFGFCDYFFVSDLDDKQPKFISCVPEALTARYVSEKMYRHDMLVSHATNCKKPVFASALYKYLLDAPVVDDALERQRQIHHLFKSHGYYDAYIMPIAMPEIGGPAVMFYLFRLCSPYDLACSVKNKEVMMLALGEAISAVFKTHHVGRSVNTDTPSLTPRQLKVLNTLATTDLTINNMAKLLNISVVTANKHLDSIRRAFNTKTNHAAVLKAIAAGLMEPPYQS